MKKTNDTNNQNQQQQQQSYAELLENYLKSREVFNIDDEKCTLIVDGFKYTAGYLRKRALFLHQRQVIEQATSPSLSQENNDDSSQQSSRSNNDTPNKFNSNNNNMMMLMGHHLENRNLGSIPPMLSVTEDEDSRISAVSDDSNSAVTITLHRSKKKVQQQQQNQQPVSSNNTTSNNNNSNNNNNLLNTQQLVTSFFLSHFHSDHYEGLHENFRAGRIFCSPITAALLKQRWPPLGKAKVQSGGGNLIQVLELDKYYRIDLRTGKLVDRGHPPLRTRPLERNEVDVICVDANHCPGAVVFIFHSLIHGIVVHTGDFRYNGVSPAVEHEAFVAARNSWNTTSNNNNLMLTQPSQDDDEDEIVGHRQQHEEIEDEANNNNNMMMMMMAKPAAAPPSNKEKASETKPKKPDVFSMMMNPNRNSQMFASNKKGNARIAPTLGPSVKRGNTSTVMPNRNSINTNGNSTSFSSNTNAQSSATRNSNGTNNNNNKALLLDEKLKSVLPLKTFPLCDRPNKKVGDESALQCIKGNVSILYLDNTFCDPKFAFSPQPQILTDACVEVGKRIGNAIKDVLIERQNTLANQNNVNDEDSAQQQNNDSASPIRIGLCIGAYSIGKERVALAIHEAFSKKVKFLVPPNRAELMKCCEMPIKMLKNTNKEEEEEEEVNVEHPLYVEVDPNSNFYSRSEVEERIKEQKQRYEHYISTYLNPPTVNNNSNNNNAVDPMSLKWNSEQFSRVVDPSKIEIDLSESEYFQTICQELSIDLNSTKNQKFTLCAFIVDMGSFSYPSVSQSITGNACFLPQQQQQNENHDNNNNNMMMMMNQPPPPPSATTTNKSNARTQSPAIFSINDNFSIDLNDFDYILSLQPTGWANSGPQSQDKRCKQVTMIGVPYSEHSSFTEMIDFVSFLQPERVVPTVSLLQYKKQEQEFLKKCKRLKIEHGSTPPLTRHFQQLSSASSHQENNSSTNSLPKTAATMSVVPAVANQSQLEQIMMNAHHNKNTKKNTPSKKSETVIDLDDGDDENDDEVVEISSAVKKKNVSTSSSSLPQRRDRNDSAVINLISSDDD